MCGKKECVSKPGHHQNKVLAGPDLKHKQDRLHARGAGRRKGF